MKILLSSNREVLKQYLPINSTVGFIGVAYELKDNQDYIIGLKKSLIDMGYNLIDINISSDSREDILNKFNILDAVFVSGGNCFYLLQQLKIKDVFNELIEFASKKIYIGESAGACIASPSIKYVDVLDDINDAPLLSDYSARNLIDGDILPHYNSSDKYTLLEDSIMKKNLDVKFIKLSDNQALIVNDREDYHIVSSK